MRGMLEDEITLELARLQRAAIARVHQRNAMLQLGEAWAGLEEVREVSLQPVVLDQSSGCR